MLNELKEYEEYIKLHRLKHPNLLRGKKHAELSGLSRALTVIARNFIYDSTHENEDKPNLFQAEVCLKAYLFPDIEDSDFRESSIESQSQDNTSVKYTKNKNISCLLDILTEYEHIKIDDRAVFSAIQMLKTCIFKNKKSNSALEKLKNLVKPDQMTELENSVCNDQNETNCKLLALLDFTWSQFKDRLVSNEDLCCVFYNALKDNEEINNTEKYKKNCCSLIGNNEEDDKKVAYLPRKIVSYQSELYTESTDSDQYDDNDFYKISFQKVLADAWQLGKLKEYVLLCKDKNILRSNKNNHIWKNTTQNHHANLGDNDRDKILKTIAAILLSKKHNENDDAKIAITNDFSEVNLAALSNWMTSVERSDRIKYHKYRTEGKKQVEHLFIEDKSNPNKIPVKKMAINKAVSDQFKICDIDNTKDIKQYIHDNPNAAVYMDCGSKAALKEITDVFLEGYILCCKDTRLFSETIQTDEGKFRLVNQTKIDSIKAFTKSTITTTKKLTAAILMLEELKESEIEKKIRTMLKNSTNKKNMQQYRIEINGAEGKKYEEIFPEDANEKRSVHPTVKKYFELKHIDTVEDTKILINELKSNEYANFYRPEINESPAGTNN